MSIRGIVVADQTEAAAIDAQVLAPRGGVRCLRVSREIAGWASLTCACTALVPSAQCLWVERRYAETRLGSSGELVYPVAAADDSRLSASLRLRIASVAEPVASVDET